VKDKRISAAVLAPLQDALTAAYWYKSQLRTFLNAATGEPQLMAQLDWSQYKRFIVRELVEKLAADQHKYFDTLFSLLLATADIGDPKHLKKLDDNGEQYREAVEALETLNLHVAKYRQLQSESEEIKRRQRVDRELAAQRQVTSEKLCKLKDDFLALHKLDPQTRGYKLEEVLNNLFRLHEINAKGPFRILGEQIDGAFTFEGTEFLLEAKWQKELSTTSDIDIFFGKVERKLDNTLGMFFSMSGFQKNALSLAGRGKRPALLLADGADLMLVLEGHLDLHEP
jgi:hypothetical protein